MERPKSDPLFKTLDDKWMFTPSRFARLGRAAGFCECRPFTTREPQNLFHDYMAMFLRLKCGLTPQALPPGAWDIVAYYDRIFSDDLKNDVMMDGGVVFRK